MNKYIYILLLAGLLTGCYSANSYSTLSREEKALVRDFIDRQKITLTRDLPSDERFAENPKLYYDSISYYGSFYYHLDVRGADSAYNDDGELIPVRPVEPGRKVVVRYIQYTLKEHSDTASHWTTQDDPVPTEFVYGANGGSMPMIPTGWHYAIGLMKYPGSECTVIIPSRLGDFSAQNSVTPYGYRLKLVRIK